MPFSRSRYVPNAVELGPCVRNRIKAPDIIEPLEAIRSSKPVQDQYSTTKIGKIVLTDRASRYKSPQSDWSEPVVFAPAEVHLRRCS